MLFFTAWPLTESADIIVLSSPDRSVLAHMLSDMQRYDNFFFFVFIVEQNANKVLCVVKNRWSPSEGYRFSSPMSNPACVMSLSQVFDNRNRWIRWTSTPKNPASAGLWWLCSWLIVQSVKYQKNVKKMMIIISQRQDWCLGQQLNQRNPPKHLHLLSRVTTNGSRSSHLRSPETPQKCHFSLLLESTTEMMNPSPK